MKNGLLAIALLIPSLTISTSTASTVWAANLLPEKVATVNTSKWRQVPVPFRPLNIAAQGNTLWICGVNESIVSSTDQGSTWNVQHKRNDGEILLNIAFVDEKVGHAAGTGGLLLITTDGGRTWSSHHAASTIRRFSFTNALDGIVQLSDSISITNDGGEHWQQVTAMQTDEKVRPFSQILSLAALNATHFAIALHQPQGENIFLSTTDGGKNWVPTHVENTFAGTLIVHDGEYWAFGIEYLGREHNPGGGYSAPVTLHSRDARTWTHVVRATNEWNGCNDQGCFLPYGVIEITFGPEEKILSTPQDIPLNEKWALSNGTICMVKEQLLCGSAIASAAPQPMRSDTVLTSDIPFEQRAPFADGCLTCDIGNIPPDPRISADGGTLYGITVSFTERKDGSVEDVSIEGLPSAPMLADLSRQISKWLLEPAHHGTAAVMVKKRFVLTIDCFPAPRGEPASSSSCTATPSRSQVNER